MADVTKDTQWMRFEVFLQERPDRSHRSVGSVHAPDGEIALQNARDVFARRPHAHSLWVAPVHAILARTQQELEDDDSVWAERAPQEKGMEERYHVFQKQSQRRSMLYVEHTGDVMAASPEEALRMAIRQYGAGTSTYVWWICPEREMTCSTQEDVPSMFAPAEQKTYRRPQEYRTVSMMHELKATGAGQDEE